MSRRLSFDLLPLARGAAKMAFEWHMDAENSQLWVYIWLVLSYWAKIGVVVGPVLIVISRFRWRIFLELTGVLVTGVSLGAAMSGF